LESKKIKDSIVEILESKKAKDLSVVDISKISILADYFIICSGTSVTHIRALADEVLEKMKDLGYYNNHKEGYSSARWILLDYGEVVVHIFHEDERSFYNLDRLWADGIEVYKER
jgi:ribosome-associated protein